MANQSEEKTITNICYDVLERILDELDLNSLLNVARTCKRLQIAAAFKFGEKFPGTCFEICWKKPNINDHFRGFQVGTNMCLPFLRCFGSKLTNLRVLYNFVRGKEDDVDRYINQYCADTLTSISFGGRYGTRSVVVHHKMFQTPFKNVVKVSIMNHNLMDQLPNLANWFPNVHHLELDSVEFDETATEVTLPHLQYLKFDRYIESNKNLAKFLHANPQLQCFVITLLADMPFALLVNMLSNNTSISKLVVRPHGNLRWLPPTDPEHIRLTELMQFASEHPTITNLNLMVYRLSVDDVIVFLDQMKSLKRFTIYNLDDNERVCLFQRLGTEWKNESVFQTIMTR